MSIESICGYPGTRTRQILIASRVRFIDQSSKRKKNVRAHTQLTVFARLAFTPPSKNCDKFINATVRVMFMPFISDFL
jgi:hypothetical protein